MQTWHFAGLPQNGYFEFFERIVKLKILITSFETYMSERYILFHFVIFQKYVAGINNLKR